VVTSFNVLFSPSTDHASFLIKNHTILEFALNSKWCMIVNHTIFWFSLIQNDALSDDGLNKRPKLVTIVNY